MASIPASTAQTNAQTALTALQTADGAIFIADVDTAIQDAIAHGFTQISANTFGNVNTQAVTAYYVALGYKVAFPEFQNNFESQPAQLFGEVWVAFWAGTSVNGLGFDVSKNPIRMIISWA